jgi:hypothetical protein
VNAEAISCSFGGYFYNSINLILILSTFILFYRLNLHHSLGLELQQKLVSKSFKKLCLYDGFLILKN